MHTRCSRLLVLSVICLSLFLVLSGCHRSSPELESGVQPLASPDSEGLDPSSIPSSAPGTETLAMESDNDVSFSHHEVSLAGTLSLPSGDGPHPAVVLISGSGSQDRNEESPAIPGYRPFQWIADHLVRHGIAALRFDDRGVGASTGAGVQEGATSVDFAEDAEAALAYLVDQPEIDSSRVGLIGHSEGAMLAAMIAARNPNVAFVISLAGPVLDGISVLQAQMRRTLEAAGLPEEEIANSLAEQRQTFELALAEDWEGLDAFLFTIYRDKLAALPEETRSSIGDLDAVAAQKAAGSGANLRTPYIRYFLAHDPRDDWQEVTVPVLALFGELDVQCDVHTNRPALEEALAQARNDTVTVTTFPRANHLFQEGNTGAMSEYAALPNRFVEELLPTISDWLSRMGFAR